MRFRWTRMLDVKNAFFKPSAIAFIYGDYAEIITHLYTIEMTILFVLHQLTFH